MRRITLVPQQPQREQQPTTNLNRDNSEAETEARRERSKTLTEHRLRLGAVLHAEAGLFAACNLQTEHRQLLAKLSGVGDDETTKLVQDAVRGSKRKKECSDLKSLSGDSYVRVRGVEMVHSRGSTFHYFHYPLPRIIYSI